MTKGAYRVSVQQFQLTRYAGAARDEVRAAPQSSPHFLGPRLVHSKTYSRACASNGHSAGADDEEAP